MKSKTLLAAAIVVLPTAVWAEGASPWLPIPGQFTIGANHTEHSGDSAYIGSTEVPLSGITMGGASKYKRATTQLRFGYGLSDAIAIDATIGYGKVRVGAADRSSGSTDRPQPPKTTELRSPNKSYEAPRRGASASLNFLRELPVLM